MQFCSLDLKYSSLAQYLLLVCYTIELPGKERNAKKLLTQPGDRLQLPEILVLNIILHIQLIRLKNRISKILKFHWN